MATGVAAGRGRGGFSAQLESVSRAVGITAARAAHWRAQFLGRRASRAAHRMLGTKTIVRCRPRSASC